MALRRSLTALAGLALMATTMASLAAPASADIVAPNDNGGDVLPPPPLAPVSTSGLPSWAVLAIVAGTIMLAVATTLITLAITRNRLPRAVEATPGGTHPQVVDLDPAAEALGRR